MYTVKIDQFEGPLDLLLELIEDKKLVITEISLANVTDQFLDYVRNNNDKITAENLSSFLVTASILVLIKSRALLPFLELTKEEEEDIGGLEAQLKEYQRFRQAAKILGEKFNLRAASFSRERKEIANDFFYPPKGVDAGLLKEVFFRIVDDLPVVPELPKDILKSKISVENQIRYIADLIKKRVELAFNSLVESGQGREHIIVNFLAVLELTRQKLVTVEQSEVFGEIMISKPASSAGCR